MYAWETHETHTQQIKQGMLVCLNPDWSAYQYLKREFGHLFPSGVAEVHGDLIRVGKLTFARHVLSAYKHHLQG